MEIAERIGHSEFWAMSAGSLTWILPQTGKIGEALEVQAQVWSKLDTLKHTRFCFCYGWVVRILPHAIVGSARSAKVVGDRTGKVPTR